MKCSKCKFYEIEYEDYTMIGNECEAFGFSNFKPTEKCEGINDDYTLTEVGEEMNRVL